MEVVAQRLSAQPDPRDEPDANDDRAARRATIHNGSPTMKLLPVDQPRALADPDEAGRNENGTADEPAFDASCLLTLPC